MKLINIKVVYKTPSGKVEEATISAEELELFVQTLNGNACMLIELIMDKEGDNEKTKNAG